MSVSACGEPVRAVLRRKASHLRLSSVCFGAPFAQSFTLPFTLRWNKRGGKRGAGIAPACWRRGRHPLVLTGSSHVRCSVVFTS